MLHQVNAPATWALSNHDTPRVASRHGDQASRALALFVMALPGSFYIYNGQELGLPDADLVDSDRQDPAFFRTKGVQKGRDGARVPMPWIGAKTPFGFSSGKPWLPIPQSWLGLSVDDQEKDLKSTLHLYRKALAIRREFLVGSGDITWVNRGENDLLSFARGEFAVYLNASKEAVEIPSVGKIAIGSNSQVTLADGHLTLPPASSAWIAIR